MADHSDAAYGRIDRQVMRGLATTPPGQDGPLWMINLMRHQPRAD